MSVTPFGSCLIEYSEIIDWWETERRAASQACFALQDELFERAECEIKNISHKHLLTESSNERQSLETSISKAIHKLDTTFLMATTKDTGQETSTHEISENISRYDGWSFWDIGKIIAGGGSVGGVAIAGGRAAPLALPVAGLASLAAPVTAVAGIAGLAWSAYSVSGQKRSEYLETLKAGVVEALTATDQPDKSVLSRQLVRLDALRDLRLERLK